MSITGKSIKLRPDVPKRSRTRPNSLVCKEPCSRMDSYKLEIPKNPSLWDIELANIEAASVPQGQPITLQLPRNIRVHFLADIAVARLIATLQERSGGLTVRDYYDSWAGNWVEATRDRFLREIDGATALIYCAGNERKNELENRRKEKAPAFLRRDLLEHVARTGYLEELAPNDAATMPGPSRTFFAIDPEYPVPPGMTSSEGRWTNLDQVISALYQQFGSSFDKNETRHKASLRLYEALYELFQNTIDHGRQIDNDQIRPGVRFIRFYKYIGLSNQDLIRRAAGFNPLRQYFERRESDNFKFLEVTIGDGGPGILSHFTRSENSQRLEKGDPAAQMNQILTTNLSSKFIPGAGLGLPLALSALSSLQAFASLRSDNVWLYRDFSLDSPSVEGHLLDATALSLKDVPTERSLARTAGTHFSVLIGFPH